MQTIVDRVVLLAKLEKWLRDRMDEMFICPACAEAVIDEVETMRDQEVACDALSRVKDYELSDPRTNSK